VLPRTVTLESMDGWMDRSKALDLEQVYYCGG